MAITADILKSKFGFNDPNVISGILSNPDQVARYEREYSGMTGGSSGGSSGGSANYDDSAFQMALKLQQQAIEPVISNLEAQKAMIPQTIEATRQGLETTKQTVEKRYDNLLLSLTNRQSADVASIGLNTSREFGKRGVPLSSGVYDQTLQEKTQPVNQFYSGLFNDTSLEKESNLLGIASQIAQLPTEQQKQLQAIDLSISEARLGNTTRAVEILMSMGASKNAANQFAQQMAQQASQFTQSQEQNASQFSQNLALNQAQLDEQRRQFDAQQKTAKTGTAATTASNKSQLISLASSGWTITDLMNKFAATLDPATIVQLYTLYSPFGPPKEEKYQPYLKTANTGFS